MKKVIVFGGGGDMGLAASYAMSKLGYKVQVVDPNSESRDKAYKHLKETKLISKLEIKSEANFSDVDVAISTAPYAYNEKIAWNCFQEKVPYCDLGGNPQVSEKIQRLATQNDGCAFTDLGVAPGLINILGESAWNNFTADGSKIKSIDMMVGGLPNNPQNKLKYSLVFNMGGLYNELTGDCEVLEDGKVVTKKALSTDLKKFKWRRLEEYEATITKGGLSHSLELMKNRGVENCTYQTIRFCGHFEFIKFLLEECEMDFKEFSKFIKRACSETKDDFILMAIEVDGKVFTHKINSDETWTAMQKATAFPTAAAASIMAESSDLPSVMNYSHIPLKTYSNKLELIGGIGNPLSEMWSFENDEKIWQTDRNDH